MPKPLLYDMLARHQIFLEGVKVFAAQKFNARLIVLQDLLQSIILSVPHDNLGQLSSRELNVLILRVQRAAQGVMNAHEKEVLDFLLAVMIADHAVAKEIFSIDKPTAPPADPAQLATKAQAADERALWAYIQEQPLPSDGSLIPTLIAGYGAAAVLATIKAVRMGYANNDTPKGLLDAIVGTVTNNNRDGMLARLYRDNAAIINTAIQHVSTIVTATLASFIYDEYEWVSVIDSGTTDICLSRNGNIYKYGKGPLPPAHFGCRSITVPFNGEATVPGQTYFGWLKTQPNDVLTEIMSIRDAARFRAGDLKASDLPRFKDAKALSIAEFRSKLPIITAA